MSATGTVGLIERVGLIHNQVSSESTAQMFPYKSRAELFSAEELTERLKARSAKYYADHTFHKKMQLGLLTPEQIRGWVANRYYYQKSIPIKDAAILANCPYPEVRQFWMQRMAEHDGQEEGQGGIEAWLRLAEGVGLTREEVVDERHIVAGVRFAVDAYINFARTRPWIIVVASSLNELFAPDKMKDRISAFQKHYTWIDTSALVYFGLRLSQAPRDGGHALALIHRYCDTRELQDQAVAAHSFKCDVLWTLIVAIHNAYGAG